VAIPHQEKSFAADTIAESARAVGIPAESADGIEEALGAVSAMALDSPPRVLIAGSLYLAGEVLALNGTPPE
jgi:dihydrofolate synthase / folylpolyglutamate synthase